MENPGRELFDLPDLTAMDDRIANGTHEVAPGAPEPLALFTAPRVDCSLHRLRHYTGTSPEHFQNFVLFTNDQFYIDEFIAPGERENGLHRLHSRKLRSFAEVAFQLKIPVLIAVSA